MPSQIPIIDLFAGPGGLGEGFASLRNSRGEPVFRLRLSVEKDEHAHRTLRLRALCREFGDDVPDEYFLILSDPDRTWGKKLADLEEGFPEQANEARLEARCAELGVVAEHTLDEWVIAQKGEQREFVLIGGPPCQAYSLAGRSRNRGKSDYVAAEDDRHFLYQHYLRLISQHRPAAFVMENVPGLLTATVANKGIFEQIWQDLRQPSDDVRYDLWALNPSSMLFSDTHEMRDFVVNMDRHGIPQARKRLIIVGFRSDLGASLAPLSCEESSSVREALSGLPRLRSGLSREPDGAAQWHSRVSEALSTSWGQGEALHDELRAAVDGAAGLETRGDEAFQLDEVLQPVNGWTGDQRLRAVWNHATRGHRFDDLHRYLFAATFAEVHENSPTLRDFPESLLPDHANVKSALNGGLFSDRFRVQVWDRPSTTITAHISKDGHYYIHPDPSQCRSLTVREAARLQTFPDDYFFTGPRTEQYRQVGNAVPPALARQVAARVAEALGA